MRENGLKEKTLANLLWKFLERIFAQGVSTIVSIVLARILMPSDYGVVTVVLIFINICNVFVSEGFASALIQKKDADQKDFSSMFYASAVLSICIYLILFLAAPLISDIFGEGYELLTPILRVLCLRIPISAINSIQQAYVSRNLMFKKFFWSTSIGTFISAFVGVGLAVAGFGSWALVAQYLTNTIIDTCVLWFTVKWRPLIYFSFERVKNMLSFGSKLLVAGLVDSLYNELRSIIIGRKYTSADLAFYNKGKQFPQLIVTNINTSLMAVLYPVMSKFQDNIDQLRAVAVKSIKLSTYVIFPCMIGFAAVSELFISLVLTDKWLSCAPYAKIFCIVYSFYPVYTANLQAIKAVGRSDAYLITEISKKVVGIICLIGSIRYGVYGIALSLLISTILNYIINGISASIILKYKFIHQIRDILPNVILVIAMFFAVRFVPIPMSSKAIILIMKCFVGATIYFLFSIITRNENLDILVEMIKSKRMKRNEI